MMMINWKRTLISFLCLALSARVVSSAEQDERILDEDRVRTDLVRLIPFDVQIAMTGPASLVNIYALTDIVNDWMNDSFNLKASNQGLLSNATTFDSVALELNTGANRRNLQDAGDIGLYTASFNGVSLWNRKGLATPPMDPELVELIQRATFLEDKNLLVLLQDAEEYTGLGSSVVDVRAFITPPTQDTSTGSSSTDSNLEIIIIIAIVVACLAFGLLMFAVIWAWKTDQNKRDAYKDRGSLAKPTDGTGSESDYENQSPPKARKEPSPYNNHHHNNSRNNSNNHYSNEHHISTRHEPVPLSPVTRPPTEIENNNYPESVISEDISTSLTAYYKSGMTGYNVPKREMNDAASMSSMDSYGYSLDGYAPSLGPTQMGYPVGPLPGKDGQPVNGQIKDPNDDDGTLEDKKIDP